MPAPDLTFTRRRVRGGVVQIFKNGQFTGEIATCRWGYALRLPGVYWSPVDDAPRTNIGGMSQRGFKRQKDAIAYVQSMPSDIVSTAAAFCAARDLKMA